MAAVPNNICLSIFFIALHLFLNYLSLQTLRSKYLQKTIAKHITFKKIIIMFHRIIPIIMLSPLRDTITHKTKKEKKPNDTIDNLTIYPHHLDSFFFLKKA